MLRKQLARMRKEAQKPEIVKYEAVLAPPEFEVEKCSTCDGINIGKMTMPTGSILTVCKGCGKRASTGKKIE